MESRRMIMCMSVCAVILMLIIPLVFIERSSQRERAALQAKLGEISAVAGQYRSLKGRVDSLEQRGLLSQKASIVTSLDGITAALGMKGKVKSIKAAGSRETPGALNEESAEVQIEKITMNDLMNILYRIDDAPLMLSLKRIVMKKSFENPELLDVTMTVSLFTKK